MTWTQVNAYWWDGGAHTVVIIHRDGVPVRYEAWRKREGRGRAEMLDGYGTFHEARVRADRDARSESANAARGEQAVLL